MSTELYLVYLATVIVLLAAPGPMTLLTLSTSVRFGHRQALATILGSNLAGMILMVLSATGLGALITSQPALYDAMRYGGAAYLVWLGVSAWRTRPGAVASNCYEQREGCAWRLFRKTLIVGLSNPKGLIFFAALFPQFISREAPLVPQFLQLSLSFTLVDFIILNLVAFGGCRLANRLSNPAAQKVFNRASGTLFVALGGAIMLPGM